MLGSIPYNHEVTPFVVFIIITATISTILFLFLLKRYLERKTEVIKHLTLTVFCWLVGTLAYSLGLISWYFIDDRIWIYDYSLPLGYASIVVSTYFVLNFAVILLNYEETKKQRILKVYAAYMITMVILFFLPQNQWGDLPPIPTFRMINLVLLISGNLIVYSKLIFLFRDLRSRIPKPFEKKKLYYVQLFFVLLLTTFVLMVFNEIILMFWDNPPPYGPLEYLAWAIGIVGLVDGYLALILPDWFKERIKKDLSETE